jgi:glycosyltransferase involved in cell wall biosynthesis
LRILIVTRQLGRSYFQGTERYVSTLGAELRSLGHEVRYLAGDPRGLGGSRELGEEVDERESIHGYPTHGWLAVQGLPADALSRWLERVRPDVVHVTNPAHIGIGALEACRRLGLPTVVTAMDFWWICPRSTLLRADDSLCDGSPGWRECMRCIAASVPASGARRAARALAGLSPGLTLAASWLHQARRGTRPADALRWTRRREILVDALNQVDRIVFPSRATCDALRPRLTHQRWSIIPYGLANGWFRRGAPRGAPKPPGELVVGYAGALLPHKAPHLLFDAIRALGWSSTRVRIAGPPADTAYWRILREKARGLRVEFLGLVPSAEMPAFLAGLDVLAVTSVWPENLPFALLEAQAAGVTVVASDGAGIVDQVSERGYLFAPGRSDGLAEALEFARTHPDPGSQGKVRPIREVAAETVDVYRAARRRAEPAGE